MQAVSLNRVNTFLIFSVITCIVLFYARSFLVPITFGAMLAMLMYPLCNWLEQRGINRIVAILICLLLIFLAMAAIFLLVTIQVSNFSDDAPQIQSRFQQQVDALQKWIEQKFGMSSQRQTAILKKNFSAMGQSAGAYVQKLVSGVIGGLTTLGIVLVYVFFFLFKREKFENFILKLNTDNRPGELKEMMGKISKVAINYLRGRLISMLIIAVLNTAGFLIIGLKHAVLLGLIATLPTIVPYVGPIMGGFFPIAMALISQSPGSAVAVVGVLFLVQTIDNYFIEPVVVGSSVNVSPFMTIVIIIVGELLWGVAGMVLFIPLLAISKIIFDHVPSLHPYGYLVGGDEEESDGIIDKVKGWWHQLRQKKEKSV